MADLASLFVSLLHVLSFNGAPQMALCCQRTIIASWRLSCLEAGHLSWNRPDAEGRRFGSCSPCLGSGWCSSHGIKSRILAGGDDAAAVIAIEDQAGA
jgi:hypothetical protein